jgi:hypothetical protein
VLTLSNEERTAIHFDSVRHDPVRALMFLREMPKGGDLHSHLSGAIYAETYIRWAAEDNLCVQTSAVMFTRPPCDTVAGVWPASRARIDDGLHDLVVDALSMRNWHASRNSGHSQFFDSFERFRLVAGRNRMGDMLGEVTSRAAAGRVSYLELMTTPEAGGTSAVAQRVGYDDNHDQLRNHLLNGGLRDVITAARRSIDAGEARRDELQRCGSARASSGCDVVVRYLYQVGRARSAEHVFAQMLTGFELASADARVVGLNMVQPEDHPVAMRDFSLHMHMIAQLRRHYPQVNVTLHAGELAAGLVPPEGLRFHIRESVGVAGARRIGHGVTIAHEDSADALLERMARERILVEIALSSNDAILGVRGRDHPLATYMRRGVPVTLVTDDEGVLRSDLTLEYLKATREHDLGYVALKTFARNSIAYAFAEESVKTRLLLALETSFRLFEARYGGR